MTVFPHIFLKFDLSQIVNGNIKYHKQLLWYIVEVNEKQTHFQKSVTTHQNYFYQFIIRHLEEKKGLEKARKKKKVLALSLELIYCYRM